MPHPALQHPEAIVADHGIRQGRLMLTVLGALAGKTCLNTEQDVDACLTRLKAELLSAIQVGREYLLVDMLDDLDQLAEDPDALLAAVRRKLDTFLG